MFAEWYWKRFGIKLDALRGRFGIGSEPVTGIVLKLFYENRNLPMLTTYCLYDALNSKGEERKKNLRH